MEAVQCNEEKEYQLNICKVLELCHLLQALLQLQENRKNLVFFEFILQETYFSINKCFSLF
jgi:hypothetical protein